jgi:hypothetical protein
MDAGRKHNGGDTGSAEILFDTTAASEFRRPVAAISDAGPRYEAVSVGSARIAFDIHVEMNWRPKASSSFSISIPVVSAIRDNVTP